MDEHNIQVEMKNLVQGRTVRYHAVLDVRCSCGFATQHLGAQRDDAGAIIQDHRLRVIEEKLGVKVSIQHIL